MPAATVNAATTGADPSNAALHVSSDIRSVTVVTLWQAGRRPWRCSSRALHPETPLKLARLVSGAPRLLQHSVWVVDWHMYRAVRLRLARHVSVPGLLTDTGALRDGLASQGACLAAQSAPPPPSYGTDAAAHAA